MVTMCGSAKPRKILRTRRLGCRRSVTAPARVLTTTAVSRPAATFCGSAGSDTRRTTFPADTSTARSWFCCSAVTSAIGQPPVCRADAGETSTSAAIRIARFMFSSTKRKAREVREDPRVTRIGLLFPGEMGALVGAQARGEVLWASEGRSEATAKRAAAFTDMGTVAELVAASDVVLSICPPAIAENVAEQVAGFDGLYVEANAI